jgi:O-antigen ligase
MIAIVVVLSAITVRYTEADVIFLEIDERFTGYTQSRSDSIREEMKEVLLGSIADNPVLGVGLGGYARDYLRSPTNMWQYELEYLALVMQLGILGFIFMVANFIVYVLRMLLNGYQKSYAIPMGISIVFWLGTPIQSSLFSGTQSAVIILSIFFLSRKQNE